MYLIDLYNIPKGCSALTNEINFEYNANLQLRNLKSYFHFGKRVTQNKIEKNLSNN